MGIGPFGGTFTGPCKICGGSSNSFTNPCYCLAGPSQETEETVIMQALAEPPPPANVVSMSTERFKRDTNPNNHSPRTALERALESFDELPSDREYTHAIVLFAIKTADGACGTKFIQAGPLDHHGQMGLIAEAQCMLREAE